MVHILPVHASKGTARCRVPLGVKMGITIVGQLLCLLLENQKERYFCQVQGSSGGEDGITSIVSFFVRKSEREIFLHGSSGGEGRFERRPSTSFA